MNLKSTFKLLFGLGLFFFFSLSLTAQNQKISIQGTLKDASGASVSDGEVEVTFKLYHETGDALWEETATVPVIGGIYSHNLGSENPLTPASIFSQPLFLGITVGGRELNPRTELTYAPYAISVASTQQIAQGGCSGQVGDIKYSILAPDDFAKENGDCWVPMNGDPIARGNKLRDTYGVTNVPDMSGHFIRATGGNAAEVGEEQSESFKEHNHGSVTDNYLKKVEGGQVADDRLVTTHDGTISFDDKTYTPPVVSSIAKYIWTGDNDESGGQSFGLRFRGDSSSRSTTKTGGTETRPLNRSFYIYIRIN